MSKQTTTTKQATIYVETFYEDNEAEHGISSKVFFYKDCDTSTTAYHAAVRMIKENHLFVAHAPKTIDDWCEYCTNATDTTAEYHPAFYMFDFVGNMFDGTMGGRIWVCAAGEKYAPFVEAHYTLTD